MLTRALGHAKMADGRPLEPDVLADPLVLEDNDVLVLSSDGLHDLVDDDEIAKTVAGRTPDEAAELLVQMACARGGHDNVTVAVISAGERAAEFDPDYVPDWGRQDETIEEPVAEAIVPPDPGRSKWLWIGLAVAAVFALLAVAAGVAVAAWYLLA